MPVRSRIRTVPLLVTAVVLGLLPGAGVAAADTGSDGGTVRVEQEQVAVPAAPGSRERVDLDTALYVPAGATAASPAPAVLVAHGFGATKASVDSDARELAGRGYVVQTWTARGFGASGGVIGLDDPDREVADASRLLDRLATRPEVQRDGPGDPRVGVTGGSYGGGLSLLLAGYDRRVDAIAPVIAWNDLGQALFPNASAPGPVPADTPARGAASGDGVFKSGWAGVFFGSGGRVTGTPGGGFAGGGGGPRPGSPTCGRFDPRICAAYADTATTGRVSPELAELLRRSSPSTVTGRITAPTLLVQGEQDTLFGLDQADANARQIAAHGTPVSVLWFAGGHDGGSPDDRVRARIGDWFDQHLRGLPAGDGRSGALAGAAFSYEVRSGVRTRGDTPTGRTVVADGYPGLPGAPERSTPTTGVALGGAPQPVVHPPGGNPATITSLPGLGSALGSLGSLGSIGGTSAPGQTARFVSDPLPDALQVAGSPRVRIAVSRVPGQPAPAEAVLFGSVTALTPDGRSTLLGNAVAPVRVPVPATGGAEVTVTLPGVVAPVPAGSRLAVGFATTDQGYASGNGAAVWRVGLAGGRDTGGEVTVPQVPGSDSSTSSVPVWPLLGIAGVLAAALVAWLVAAVLRRRRTAADEAPGPLPQHGDPRPGGTPAAGGGAAADAPPLEVVGLAKTYRNGFRAVSDVSFTVPRGAVLGLLGPNGAGKTTVLRMLLGLIAPTGGEMRAFGRPIRPGAPVLSRIGAFVEGPGFLPHLSGADNLRLYWEATGRPSADARMNEALDIAGLGDSVHRRVGTYSQGMRQRLAIAQAMLGLPELLILDEPTNGLDPPQIHAMRELLRRYASGGRTVLVSSHLLAEVEQTCTDVVVVHRGTVVADGTVAELTAAGGGSSFTVDATGRASDVLAGLDGVTDVVTGDEPGVVHAHLDGTPRETVVAALVRAGVGVSAAGPRGRLEDAFLQLVGPEGRDLSAGPPESNGAVPAQEGTR
ncbi:ATP-binding cassette domain-containing protein [Pseudonocardia phyllosphaerae]|uniref:ATP-binding cassette domain-containing protein n=1 Tax=Pseudonocardia phyllosphaerae TaxID=3390502 RepID=UPI00397A893D